MKPHDPLKGLLALCERLQRELTAIGDQLPPGALDGTTVIWLDQAKGLPGQDAELASLIVQHARPVVRRLRARLRDPDTPFDELFDLYLLLERSRDRALMRLACTAMVTHRDSRLRAVAAQHLGRQLPVGAATSLLFSLLLDCDPLVRSAARNALSDVVRRPGSRWAVARLRQLAMDEEQPAPERDEGVRALVEASDAAVDPFVTGLLTHPDLGPAARWVRDAREARRLRMAHPE